MLESLVDHFRLQAVPSDIRRERAFLDLWKRVRDHTMTSVECLFALHQAVAYLVRLRLPGDFVECGVWRGGSAMMAAFSFLHFGEDQRRLHLYDTFAGMPEPTARDVTLAKSLPARRRWERAKGRWNYASLEEVRTNLAATGYPWDRVEFVQGEVERTIPGQAPQKIALLRLDTDFYGSTRHELEHLYPRLVRGGVLILDDYAHWRGAQEAVDEYFARLKEPLLLHRIDFSARLALKP